MNYLTKEYIDECRGLDIEPEVGIWVACFRPFTNKIQLGMIDFVDKEEFAIIWYIKIKNRLHKQSGTRAYYKMNPNLRVGIYLFPDLDWLIDKIVELSGEKRISYRFEKYDYSIEIYESAYTDFPIKIIHAKTPQLACLRAYKELLNK